MGLLNREPERFDLAEKVQSPSVVHATETLAPAHADENGKVAPPRRVNIARPETRAYLDRTSRVSGKLNFEESAQIDGQVDGEINAKDSITIGEGATVTAQIKGTSIVVAGTVSGEIIASQRVEICPSAKVSAKLTTPKLVIHEGAIFDGHCTMQPDHNRKDSKVTALPKEERVAPPADFQKQA